VASSAAGESGRHSERHGGNQDEEPHHSRRSSDDHLRRLDRRYQPGFDSIGNGGGNLDRFGPLNGPLLRGGKELVHGEHVHRPGEETGDEHGTDEQEAPKSRKDASGETLPSERYCKPHPAAHDGHQRHCAHDRHCGGHDDHWPDLG
jgi:hypothetical protein